MIYLHIRIQESLAQIQHNQAASKLYLEECSVNKSFYPREFLLFFEKLFDLSTGNAGYTQWTAWGACSRTCGFGTHTKTRSCTNPVEAFGGLNCVQQGLGPNILSQACKVRDCPSKLHYEPIGNVIRKPNTCKLNYVRFKQIWLVQ